MHIVLGADAHRLDQETREDIVESYVLLVLHNLMPINRAADLLQSLGFGGLDDTNEDELITPNVAVYLERAVEAMARRDRAVFPQRKRLADGDYRDVLTRLARPNADALRRLTRQHANESVTRLLDAVLPPLGGVHEEIR